MASIRDRRKEGRGFQVRWRDPDGTQRSRSFEARRTAEVFKREVEEFESLGRRWEPPRVREAPALDDVLKEYLRHRARAKELGTVEHDAKTLNVYLRFLHQREGVRPLLVTLWSRDLHEEFYDWLRVTPLKNKTKPPGLAMCEKHLRRVELAWKWADDQEKYEPFVPRYRRIDELKSLPSEPIVAPSWDDMDACILASDGWLQRVLIVQRYTGLRVQQVMRLRWPDVDLDRAILTIRGELGKSKSEKAGRIIPISSHLVAELAGWGCREGWLVESGRTGAQQRVVRARDVCRTWARAGVSEEIWAKRPNHAFRKGVVSGLKAAGADIDAIEVLVGHKLPGQRSVYTDPNALPMREAVALIPAIGNPAARAPIRLPRLNSIAR